MYLVTYVCAKTCNVQPEAPKVQKPNIQVYKSNLECVHRMIATPPKSPPSYTLWCYTKVGKSQFHKSHLPVARHSLPCFLPSESHPINLSLSLPETKEPGFRVKISPSLGGKSKNLAPEEGDGWPHGSIHLIFLFT